MEEKNSEYRLNDAVGVKIVLKTAKNDKEEVQESQKEKNALFQRIRLQRACKVKLLTKGADSGLG